MGVSRVLRAINQACHIVKYFKSLSFILWHCSDITVRLSLLVHLNTQMQLKKTVIYTEVFLEGMRCFLYF